MLKLLISEISIKLPTNFRIIKIEPIKMVHKIINNNIKWN